MLRLLSVLALAACSVTTVAYPGPRRPPEAVATLVAGQDSRIDIIDGRLINDPSLTGRRFELLPGFHAVGFALSRVESGIFIETWKSGRTSGCAPSWAVATGASPGAPSARA